VTRAGTDRPGEVFAANRAEGHVRLTMAARRGGTRRSRVAEEGSLRVRFPGACAGAQEAVLVNTAGGIAGGDRFSVAVTLEESARLVVTTAAAEKIYRTDGPQAAFAVTATLAADAELTWLPQETILFDRARLTRTVDIAMAPSARLVFAETVLFGRSAMGETVRTGYFSDRWRVRRDGKLVFAENFRLDGAIADRLGEAAVAAGHVALGTVLMVPGDDAAVDAVRAIAGQFRGEAGISAWGGSSGGSRGDSWGGIALARLAAPDGAALRHDLVMLLSAIGRAPLPRLWVN
jgi:urease accessory protein